MIVHWVEGETAPREFILKKDGVAFVGTGLTVTLMLYDRAGVVIPTTGDVDWVDDTAGRVVYTPDATDLVAAKGDHKARFKVTDGAGGEGYFPGDEMMVWRVRKP